MQQVRLFTGTEDQIGSMERSVNDWLRTSNARVISVFGNMSPQSVMPSSENKGSLSHDGVSRRFAPSDVFMCVVYDV